MERSMKKQKIRSRKRAERDALTPDGRILCSHMICEALLQMPLIRETQAVCCYAPIGSEVDIMELAERLWAEGKRLAFPRVFPSAEADMEFYEVKGRRELVEGAFHVPEPPADGRLPVDWRARRCWCPVWPFPCPERAAVMVKAIMTGILRRIRSRCAWGWRMSASCQRNCLIAVKQRMRRWITCRQKDAVTGQWMGCPMRHWWKRSAQAGALAERRALCAPRQ